MSEVAGDSNELAELQTAFRQGFGDAFGILWQHHQERMFRFFRGKGIERDQAQDLLQEVAIRLFRYLSGHIFEIFPGSAFKITKDAIADHYRVLGRTPKLMALDDLFVLDFEPSAKPPSNRWERWSELQKTMTDCGVSKEQQTAVILHHLIGYTTKEVALITESELETVKSRLRYASLKMGRAAKEQKESSEPPRP